MTDLPRGWASAQIGDLCNLVNGRVFKPKEWANEGLPIIRIQNLNNPYAKFNYFSGILDEKHLVKREDLLFAWSGTPGTSFGAHIWRGNDAALNQHIFKIEFSEKLISRDYFCYAINQKLSEFINSAQGGVGLRHITKGTFEKTQISFPPLAEQILIAQKLDEILAKVESIKLRIDAMSAIITRYRQSVLSSAVTGRLTPNNQDGDSLWSQKTIGDICVVTTGTTPKRDEPSYWENGNIAWITSAATRAEFCSEADQFVTEHAVRQCNLKIFQPGTLILAMYGEGKTRGQVSELTISATCNQACAALIVNEDMARKEFVKIRLKENYEEIRKQAAGGAQPNLNLSKVRALTINLPSLAEQSKIVQRVEQLLTFADQLELDICSAKARIIHLPKTILAKAFNGELTADWRDANPESISGENSANLLLSQIV